MKRILLLIIVMFLLTGCVDKNNKELKSNDTFKRTEATLDKGYYPSSWYVSDSKSNYIYVYLPIGDDRCNLSIIRKEIMNIYDYYHENEYRDGVMFDGFYFTFSNSNIPSDLDKYDILVVKEDTLDKSGNDFVNEIITKYKDNKLFADSSCSKE